MRCTMDVRITMGVAGKGAVVVDLKGSAADGLTQKVK